MLRTLYKKISVPLSSFRGLSQFASALNRRGAHATATIDGRLAYAALMQEWQMLHLSHREIARQLGVTEGRYAISAASKRAGRWMGAPGSPLSWPGTIR